MKATRIELPPDVEALGQRQAIGAGQPEYHVIPAVKFASADYGGMDLILSRWELTPTEQTDVARSMIRAMLVAFSVWLAARFAQDPGARIAVASELHGDADVVLAELVQVFIREHAPQLAGPDAPVWYSRMLKPGDPYQPQVFEISTDVPVRIVSSEEVNHPLPVVPHDGRVH